ncbi:MAG: DUF3868 domain-containing protein [Muribaculaceae bacterium]|nr:DUF3868 domain-containing protein [Muribaculaceae bacterium]
MYKNLLLIFLVAAFSASAGVNSSKLYISDLAVLKSEEAMTVNMTVSPADYKVKTNNLVKLTPILIGQNDTLSLPAVTVAGRNAWYHEVRSNAADPMLLRAGKKTTLAYSATVPYQDWMAVSRMEIVCDTLSECRCDIRSGSISVAEMDFTPKNYESDSSTFAYIVPTDTIEKIFDLSGSANIVFKVNRTDIDWSYKSNYAELDSILRTIAVVKDNPDATVEQIMLTGYASPEGSYSNNVRLAKGRTEVVKNYVAQHSDFPSSVYTTSYVPEDWEGLRAWLSTSIVPDKESIIALIDDSSVAIENKNDVLRSRFPEQYAFLLANVYPSLRHTDYRITYKIRRYFDVAEIATVMAISPRNLSLNEFFLLANSYEKGSPEYHDVFLTAARIYPDSDVANLNAAFSAISQNELNSARMFLGRVAPSAETAYAWGIIYAKEGDYDKALEMLRQARDGGAENADETIRRVTEASRPGQAVRVL